MNEGLRSEDSVLCSPPSTFDQSTLLFSCMNVSVAVKGKMESQPARFSRSAGLKYSVT